jgi:hypothetical protein
MGMCNMSLRVQRRNPARAFYERFGARLVYAFDDLSALG